MHNEGLRERNKRETRSRITQAALDLFLRNGYEATTLDDIASAAAISRRTFFYYFKSKEAILMDCMDGGLACRVKPLILAQGRGSSPYSTARSSTMLLFAGHESERALEIYKLFESTEALRSRIQAVTIKMENAAFEALCELWPEPAMRDTLRIVTAVSITALRIGKEAWRKDEGRLPLVNYLEASFTALEKAMPAPY